MTKISKTDLRLGNIFREGVVCKINGRAGSKVHVCGRLEYRDGKLKNRTEVGVESLTPIELNEDVLVNWCGAVKEIDDKEFFRIHKYILSDDACVSIEEWKKDGSFDNEYSFKNGYEFVVGGKYLHELQNFFKVVKKKELEIKE